MPEENCSNCEFYRSKEFVDKKEIKVDSFFTQPSKYESVKVEEFGCHRYPPIL